MQRKTLLGVLTAALVASALLPAVDAQDTTNRLVNPSAPTPTTLYFHIFDTFNAFPINTQAPNVTFFQVGGTNFPTVVEPNTGENYDFNTIYGFATSGPVEYNFIENGQPRFHPERGIARDVQIDGSTPAFAYMYVDVRDFVGTDLAPNALPKLTFRVTVGEGNVIGPDANLDSNPVIMKGELTAYVSDTPLGSSTPTSTPDGTPIFIPDADGMVEYKIPLAFTDSAAPVIPKANAYHVRVDWYQDPTGQNPDQFAEGYMRLASDMNHHPRLTMAIKNPVYLEFIHPEVAAGILLIHTAENSPWGTYDIDVQNMTIEVTGPSTPQSLPVVVSQNSHVHNLHDKPAEVTYLWHFRDEGAESGDYQIHVTVQNLNHTAKAEGFATFHVDPKGAYGISDAGETVTSTLTEGGGKSSPGAGLLVITVALLGALAMRRRVA